MRLVIIGCTHNYQYEIGKLPDGNILIHTGDMTNHGTEKEINHFGYWLESIKDQYEKIFICAGNHDFLFQTNKHKALSLLNLNNDNKIVYLENQEFIYNGIKFYGSPVTTFYHDWAFNVHRGDDIKKYWNLIPLDTDVLITHGPPDKILDVNFQDICTGCEDLLNRVLEVKPLLHCFSHIHESRGSLNFNNTIFINNSMVNRLINREGLVYSPVVVDIEDGKVNIIQI